MKITSATFVKGVVGPEETLQDGLPQVALIGRSNVGKSSIINSLTGQQGLARTSSFPGRTQQLNVFLINKELYLIDLPGYGFAQASKEERKKIQQLIDWYLLDSGYQQKRVLVIIDATVGLTESDLATIETLEELGKEIVVVANKIDRLKSSQLHHQLKKIRETVEVHPVIPYSSTKKIGIRELTKEILG